jgi:hypothetical protein
MNLAILKNLALRTVAHKLAEETDEERLVRIKNDLERPVVIDKKKLKKTLPIWALVITSGITIAQAAGWIDSELAKALLDFFSNPAVVEGIDSAID